MNLSKFLYVLCAIPTLSLASDTTLAVYPPALQKIKQQELGDVILKLMPSSKGEKVFWDYRANDPSIVWLDSFYKEKKLEDGSFYSSRKGVARINVLGVKSTIVDRRKYELPWTVLMEGDVGKFGVNSISLYPATPVADQENICFGDNFDNCEFSPFKSLTKSKINYKKVCEKNFGALNFAEAYLLTASGKKPVFGVWESSGGSGGTSNVFKIDYTGNQKEMCKGLMGGA